MFKAIVCVLILVFVQVLPAQANSYSFESARRISYEEGLPNTKISSIEQDRNGFIWIATNDGLLRFNGNRFEKFVSEFSDSLSISSNMISKVYQDRNQQLWIGSFYGLEKYNDQSDSFELIHHKSENGTEFLIPFPVISSDSKGQLWLGGQDLYVCSPVTRLTRKIEIEANNYSSSEHRLINNVYTASNGSVYFSLKEGGLYSYNPTKNYSQEIVLDEHAQSEEKVIIQNICEDQSKRIFFLSQSNGVFVMDANHDISKISFKQGTNPDGINDVFDMVQVQDELWFSTNYGIVKLHENNLSISDCVVNSSSYETSLLSNHVRWFYKDFNSNVWIVFLQQGIMVVPETQLPFKNYKGTNKSNNNLLEGKSVKAITKDATNNLWVGTDGDGIYVFSPEHQLIEHLEYRTSDPGSISDNIINSLYFDSIRNEIWVGTYRSGLCKIDLESRKVVRFRYNRTDPFAISSNDIYEVLPDKNNNLWIATNGGGLCFYNRASKQFSNYQTGVYINNTMLGNNWLSSLCWGPNDELFIGTSYGFYTFDTRNKLFTSYSQNVGSSSGLSDNSVIDIIQGDQNIFWILTNNGINRFNFDNKTFDQYLYNSDLPSNIFNCAFFDLHRNLWLSSGNGMVYFDVNKQEHFRYIGPDGLQNYELIKGSGFQDENRQIYFGGTNGISFFNPDSISVVDRYVEPFITDFSVFNEEMNSPRNSGGRLSKRVSLADTLYLKYSDRSFTIELSALEYILPNRIRYAFKLEKFDQDWKYSDSNHRYVTYTNLNQGEYLFKYKASDANGKWNKKAKQLVVLIPPPFWKTWWAYSFYFLFANGLVFTIWMYFFIKLKAANNLRFERLKRENAERVNQAKLQFFTNISHEIRTPLTLILDPLQYLLHKNIKDDAVKKEIHLIHNNAKRLLGLINQLLDYRKVEAGMDALSVSKGDIIHFLKEQFERYTETARNREINYSFNAEVTQYELLFDHEKVERIVINLLSNAFKFTPNSGQIWISVHINGTEELVISVADNGKGIGENEQQKIFDRFYQTKDSSYQGTGIGLALCKMLADIHHARLELKSKPEQGAVFTLFLSLNESVYLSSEITENTVATNMSIIHPNNQELDEVNEILPEIRDRSVLIVEDDHDLGNYLTKKLSAIYNVTHLANGKEAWQHVLHNNVDVVVSDIMMPEMDGLELCSKLKNDLRTSHLPVILLTAQSSVDQQIEGINKGADMYIPKPLDIRYLAACINRMISKNKELKLKYKNKIALESRNIETIDPNEKFIVDASKLLLVKLDDSNFGPDQLAKEMAVSRTHLHRKLRELTGETPSEFMKKIRLNQAAHYLKTTHLNISEIALEVGFNSLPYFTSCFKKQFSETPSNFLKNNRKV